MVAIATRLAPTVAANSSREAFVFGLLRRLTPFQLRNIGCDGARAPDPAAVAAHVRPPIRKGAVPPDSSRREVSSLDELARLLGDGPAEEATDHTSKRRAAPRRSLVRATGRHPLPEERRNA